MHLAIAGNQGQVMDNGSSDDVAISGVAVWFAAGFPIQISRPQRNFSCNW